MLLNKLSGKQLITIIFASLAAQATMADDSKPHPWKDQEVTPAHSYVVTLGAGPIWENAGQTQLLILYPNIVKTYVADNLSHSLAGGELFFGLLRPLGYGLQYQLGLAFATTTNASLTGVIWDDGDPQFDNYTYKYQVNHTSFGVKGKLLAERGYYLTPWVSLSLGIAFNQAQFFSNTPTIQTAYQSPIFTYDIQTAFTYTLGAGIQKTVWDRVQLGIGYEFSDWGLSVLGPALNQSIGTGPRINHFFTNGITINATYLI